MTFLRERSLAAECGNGPAPTGRGLLPASPAQQPATRTRRFAEIESWIVRQERTLRRLTWDVPEEGVRRRLLVAQSDAHRLERLAEISRLAAARRRGIGSNTSASLFHTRGPDLHAPYRRPSSMVTT